MIRGDLTTHYLSNPFCTRAVFMHNLGSYKEPDCGHAEDQDEDRYADCPFASGKPSMNGAGVINQWLGRYCELCLLR